MMPYVDDIKQAGTFLNRLHLDKLSRIYQR